MNSPHLEEKVSKVIGWLALIAAAVVTVSQILIWLARTEGG